MTLPWPNYTTAEWEVLLAEQARKNVKAFNENQPRVPAGSSQGGEFAAVGGVGAAPAVKETRYSVMKAAGLTVAHVADLPMDVFYLKKPNERAHTERDVSAAKGIVQAFDTLRKGGFSAFADEAQETAKFVFAGYTPTNTLMSTVTKGDADPTVRFIFVNSDTPSLENVPTTKEGAFHTKETAGVHGAAEETEYYRVAALHELGHLYDSIHHQEMTEKMVDVVRFSNTPAEGKPYGFTRERTMDEMLGIVKNLSAYATASAREASAEAFSIMLSGHKLPEELARWANTVKEWGKSDRF